MARYQDEITPGLPDKCLTEQKKLEPQSVSCQFLCHIEYYDKDSLLFFWKFQNI